MSRNDVLRARFGDLLASRDERLPNDGTHPLYSLTIKDGVTPKTDRYEREFLVTNKESKKYKVIRTGDLVFNPSNLRWGAIATSFVQFPVLASPIYEVFHPKDSSILDPFFLGVLASSPTLMAKYLSLVEGTLVERTALKKDDFLEIEVEIPPLPEQKKIAEILSGIDNARTGLVTLREKYRALLTSLRQKIFDEREVSNCTFEEIIEQRDLGTTRRGTGEGSNIPLVKMGDITRGEIRIGANERIEYSDDIKDLLLKKGDILFNTRNTPSLVGKTAIFDSSMRCCYDNNLMRIRLVPWVSPWFLNHLMNSPRFLQILSSISSGTTSVAAIYWNDLKRIRIPLPSLSRQQQLADSIDAVIEVISGVSSAISSLENTRSAISADLLSGRKRVIV